MSLFSNPLAVGMVAGSGALSAAVDCACRRVPNALTLGIAAIGLALASAHASPLSPLQAIGGLSIGLLVMLPGYLLGATGGGDVKLFAALGTMLGPSRTGMAFLYTALAGAALALVVAWRRRRLATTVRRLAAAVGGNAAVIREIEQTTHNRFAYAPAIAVGALLAAMGV